MLDFMIHMRCVGDGKRVREAAEWLLAISMVTEDAAHAEAASVAVAGDFSAERIEEMLEFLVTVCCDPHKRQRIAVRIARVMGIYKTHLQSSDVRQTPCACLNTD